MADLFEGRDEGGEADDAAIREQLGHFGDSSDVLLAVLRREAQVLVEAVSDVVAIKTVRRDALRHQVLLQREADRRLSRSRETWSEQTTKFKRELKNVNSLILQIYDFVNIIWCRENAINLNGNL